MGMDMLDIDALRQSIKELEEENAKLNAALEDMTKKYNEYFDKWISLNNKYDHLQNGVIRFLREYGS